MPRQHKRPEAQALAPTASGASPGVSCAITIDLIQPSANNPRKTFDKAALSEMADSIRQFGVIEPIVVRPLYRFKHLGGHGDAIIDADAYHADPSQWPLMTFELVAGERRVRAAKLAGLQEVPAIIRRLNDAETLAVQLVENLQRADVSPIEFARGLKRLRHVERPDSKLAAGMTYREIAAQIGKSEASVRSALLLVDDANPPELVLAIENGLIAPSVAELICRLPAEKRLKAIEMVMPETGCDLMGFRRAKDLLARRFGPKEPNEAEKQRRPPAEAAESLGLTKENLDAAYIGHKLSCHVKEPIKISHLKIDGELYVATGSNYDGKGTTTVDLLPLHPVSFNPPKLHNANGQPVPDAEARRREYYQGVLVQCRGQWYVVGSKKDERKVSLSEPSKAKPTVKSAARKTTLEVNMLAITRSTLLADLLTGKDAVEAGRALDKWAGELEPTVGRLLDRCGPAPRGQSTISKHYAYLRKIDGLSLSAANAIGDRLVDAGLIIED